MFGSEGDSKKVEQAKLASLQLLKLAHRLLADVVEEGDRVIDATIGNGHDTLFLAQQVGASGGVDGFDIQQVALDNTRKRFDEAEMEVGTVNLHCIGHERMEEYVKTEVKAIVFNLGYLPSADKNVITLTETTLTALEKATLLLAKHGLLTVMCYPGHEGGENEGDRVTEWFSHLERRTWNVVEHRQLNAPESAPFLIAAYRTK